MVTINSIVFTKFIKKLTLEKMIEEVTFVTNNGLLESLTCDKLHQLIIDGSCKLESNDSDESLMFTVGLIKEFYTKVKTLSGIISLDVVDNVLTLSTLDKVLKVGLVNPNSYHGIKSVYTKDIRSEEISVKIRDTNVVYSDFINCTGKELKGYLEQCKIIDSNAYLLSQLEGKIKLSSESKLKRDSVKLDVNLPNVFKNDKLYWVYNFVKYILDNNSESLNVYIEKSTDPMVIHVKDDSSEILYVMAPK